jgi:hypothetical protein
MLTSPRNGRDNSGHSGHPYKYRGFGRPESASRVFRLGTDVWDSETPDSIKQSRVRGASGLDCAVATTRPMSRTETAAV